MSNLLERAVIDAKALKEAALKNAEQLVIEKYSLEVKEAMTRLLEDEQADAMADLFGDDQAVTQDAAMNQEADAENQQQGISQNDLEAQLPDAFSFDDEEVIKIKLDSLDAEFEDDEDDELGVFGGDDKLDDDEIGVDIDLEDDDNFDVDADTSVDIDPTIDSTDITVDADISPESLEEMIADALQDALKEGDGEGSKCYGPDRFQVYKIYKGKCTDVRDIPKGTQNEEQELDEEIDLEDLMERVRVDFEPQKSGWAGTPESIMKEYEAMLLAREQDSEVKEENEELRKSVSALQKENKTLSSAANKLQNQNKEYKTAFKTLQEKLETMNVSNAKLLYINQALENASLNERQKRKIVEAISKAGTVQEAKIVFETMSDTVATTSDVKKETTLSEMVSRKSSLLVAARKEQPKQDANPLFNRMQTLAGIETK